jgi:hypothetical protein
MQTTGETAKRYCATCRGSGVLASPDHMGRPCPTCNPFTQPCAPPMWMQPRGCICPSGSEKTCRGIGCPRQPVSGIT